MKASNLLNHWEKEFGEPLTDTSYQLPLNVKDAARLEALAEMFPGCTKERLLRDLVSSALADLTSGFPYVAGDKVVAQDEDGDPIYEDAGPTPQFLKLTRKHLSSLQKDSH
ncbi:MAG: pilin assembly protein [Oleibacter sp.]|nr:pilin assembly protein [Thalassolituus sp.]|tara:strand:+ start:267 stop:599 length:333 start_codon:yes stop_codon:yes gene_type:complete